MQPFFEKMPLQLPKYKLILIIYWIHIIHVYSKAIETKRHLKSWMKASFFNVKKGLYTLKGKRTAAFNHDLL